MNEQSPDSARIKAMRAAHDSFAETAEVVQTFREGGDLYQALRALDARWPELSVPPWRRVDGGV